jgi:hypothetical protein
MSTTERGTLPAYLDLASKVAAIAGGSDDIRTATCRLLDTNGASALDEAHNFSEFR